MIYKLNKLLARIQRFKRGYAYGDVWDMNCWFIDTIKPMLIHLRDYGIGCPVVLYDSNAENERKAWEDILTKMIDCLNMMDEDNVMNHLGISTPEGIYNMTLNDHKQIDAIMNENKDRFFELFSKYFWNLWD